MLLGAGALVGRFRIRQHHIIYVTNVKDVQTVIRIAWKNYNCSIHGVIQIIIKKPQITIVQHIICFNKKTI